MLPSLWLTHTKYSDITTDMFLSELNVDFQIYYAKRFAGVLLLVVAAPELAKDLECYSNIFYQIYSEEEIEAFLELHKMRTVVIVKNNSDIIVFDADRRDEAIVCEEEFEIVLKSIDCAIHLKNYTEEELIRLFEAMLQDKK